MFLLFPWLGAMGNYRALLCSFNTTEPFDKIAYSPLLHWSR